MRRQFLLVINFLLPITFVVAQNIPTTVTAPVATTARPLPSVGEPSVYYLRTLVPVMPTTDSSRVTINAWADTVNISTQYFDDLNRPLQKVIKQASPNKNDYVSENNFDEFGQVSAAYLPYTQQTANTNDGKYKNNPFNDDSVFYKTSFPAEQINYSLATHDGSPLQRVIKTTAPGNSWTGAGVGISTSWRANNIADSVRLWSIAIAGEDDIPTTTTTYLDGSLFIQETTDERGVKTIVYADELGRTILTKQQVAASPSTGHYGWLCTYYVYDEMNHLRVVIPPKAVDALNNTSANWNLTANPTIKTGLCFSYYYDARGRVTMKFIPGKGKNYFAYDLMDRIVMTQDANLGQTGQWAFVKYDGQSRPFRSGVITSALVKDSIIAQAARNSDYPTLTGTYTITSETYFDDYSWISGGAPNSTLVSTNINSTNFNTGYNTYPEYAQPVTVSNRIQGAVTGIKKIILNSSNYLYTVPLYDDHGRVIQQKETNYTGATDVLTKQYSFIGRTLRTHLQHQKNGTNAQSHTLLTKYSYDHVGRVKTIIKNIDGLGDKTIATNTYNELGQLQSKVLGSNLESMNYTYNIRGWLTGINKSFVDNASAPPFGGAGGGSFGEAIFYDYGFTNNQFNGAIAGVKWKAGGDTIARAYGFGYDNANRLGQADFSQYTPPSGGAGGGWTNTTVDFSVSNLTYDAGSNILTMKQRGLFIGSSATIDSLSYSYFSNSNQLQKVADGITDPSPLGDFKDTTLSGDDYTYDINGNINKDYNRHMHTAANGPGAVYNLLDKADSMSIAGKATLYYYYDASGAKLRKQVNDYSSGSTIVKNYLYINGFTYLNDTLQYVAHEEGRIRWAKKRNSSTGAIYYAFEYDYFLRDHLNNVRTVLTEGKDTATYMATMETADSATVQKLFSNVYDPARTVFAKPAAFDANSSNIFVSKLTGNSPSGGQGGRIGPSIVLKVMAGDQVQVNTYAYYSTATQPPVTDNVLLNDLLSSLVSGVTAQSAGKLGAGNATAVSNAVSPNVLSFLNNRSYNSSLPKAYLNWVLLDDQFNYVASNMGALQVIAGSSKQALVAPLQTMAKNGYLYIYTSNQSPQDVYFDDLTVTHTTGPLLQEQSYYPFGLQMSAISDKAINKLTSQNKFNGGVELEEDYGVNLYSTFYRQYDPQIGRFGGVDILAEKFAGINPYQFGANNPIIYNDPTGSKLVPNSILEVSDRQFSMISDALGNLDFEFMNGSSVGGGGGGGGGWGWGSTTQIPGGFSFSGSDAGQWLRGYQNAYNNPNANGDWSFSTGQNQHGDIGYWSSFSFDPGNRGDGHVNLDGVGVGTRFVLSGGEGGGSRSLEESNGWQKTGLVLGTAGVAVDLTENGIKGSQIFANSLSVTKYAIPKLAGLKALSKGFGYAGILITVGDMAVKGINYKNGTEMVFGVISLLPGPGWIIGGIYFIGNYALQQTTGVSIGQLVENIATNKEIGFGAGFNGNVISGGDY